MDALLGAQAIAEKTNFVLGGAGDMQWMAGHEREGAWEQRRTRRRLRSIQSKQKANQPEESAIIAGSRLSWDPADKTGQPTESEA